MFITYIIIYVIKLLIVQRYTYSSVLQTSCGLMLVEAKTHLYLCVTIINEHM